MLRAPATLHVVLEMAAFAVGGLLYWRGPNTEAPGKDTVSRLGIVAGAALGAAIGSRLLYVLQYWTALSDQPWQVWLGGKTIKSPAASQLCTRNCSRFWMPRGGGPSAIS